MFRKWLAEKLYPEWKDGLRIYQGEVESVGYEKGYNAHRQEIADGLKLQQDYNKNLNKAVEHLASLPKKEVVAKRKYTKRADKPVKKVKNV